MRKTIAALTAVIISLATGASAQPIPIADISSYLNGLQASTSEFTQTNANGSVDKGSFYVQRPYRMRFEYDNQPLLLLASSGQVAIFDGKSNSSHQEYPMSRTPLSLILAPNIDVERQGVITGYGEVGGQTIVTLIDPTGQTPGSVELSFAQGPQLTGWVTTDEIGNRTMVRLHNLRSGVNFKPSTFSIQMEAQRRGEK